MNYITYYFSRKHVGPAPLVFHKPTDAPNAVCCVQFGQPIELRLTSQTLVCAPWCILLPSQRKYDVSIGKNFSNLTNSWHNVISFSVKENSSCSYVFDESLLHRSNRIFPNSNCRPVLFCSLRDLENQIQLLPRFVGNPYGWNTVGDFWCFNFPSFFISFFISLFKMSDFDMSMTSSDRSSGRECSDGETDEYCGVVCRQVSTAVNKFRTTGPCAPDDSVEKTRRRWGRGWSHSRRFGRETAKSDPSGYLVKKNSSALCMSANLGYTDPKLIFLDTDRGNEVEEWAKVLFLSLVLYYHGGWTRPNSISILAWPKYIYVWWCLRSIKKKQGETQRRSHHVTSQWVQPLSCMLAQIFVLSPLVVHFNRFKIAVPSIS